MKLNERHALQTAAELLLTATFFSPELQTERSIVIDEIMAMLDHSTAPVIAGAHLTDGEFIADEI